MLYTGSTGFLESLSPTAFLAAFLCALPVFPVNKGIATVLGAFVGGAIGQNIGAQLDERDRLLAGEAYNTALEFNPTDKAAEWRNPDTGNYGRVIPVTTYRKNGRYCREFTQEIFIGGEKQTGYGRACRQPDGAWEIIG